MPFEGECRVSKGGRELADEYEATVDERTRSTQHGLWTTVDWQIMKLHIRHKVITQQPLAESAIMQHTRIHMYMYRHV